MRLACKLLFLTVQLPLLLAALHLLNGSCVTVRAPAGGPKDTLPPELIKTHPMYKSTGFQGKQIKLVFNKEIDVQDLYNKLIVMPALPKCEGKKQYHYKVSGKTLTINLASPLEKETTYTFHFNDAIKDTTEGNVVENPVLTFSTGDQLASLHIAGKVRHLLTNQPGSTIRVFLYQAASNSLSRFEGMPDYCTQTDQEGNFMFNHIKEGKYYICARDSLQNNFKVDYSTEAYGFLQEPIVVTTAPVEAIRLPILKADVSALKLISTQRNDQYCEINFSKPIVAYTLTLLDKPMHYKEIPPLYSKLINEAKVIRVYNTLGLLEEDSLAAKLVATDTLGNVVEETVKLHFKENRTALSCTVEPKNGSKINPNFVGTLLFNKPIKEVQIDRIYFIHNQQDSLQLSAEACHWNAQRDLLTIKKTFCPVAPGATEGETARDNKVALALHIAQGAFVAVDKDSNEAATYSYIFKNAAECGTIKGKVTTKAPGFVIQLLNEAYEVVDECKNEPHYQFNAVELGHYKLRVLVLKAKDAAWSFGNIHQLEEPDPVVFYPHEVTVARDKKIQCIDFDC